ncbi:hypothetical protein [Deinococcus hopiensis]|uniref:Uncharacterized protein n=1 Tax=Deinococcus hopiensis KR-140 TaxID=695939 RepID=A0A1W1VW41_9DEIO|nr:hypothetical protein [Deinococcus hopiensis]SMB97094.1 hypothetical protein SAMN00790413_06337 [Deinococcus hopiensis KR-140]
MRSFRIPKQRLPDHLKHLRQGPSGRSNPDSTLGTPERTHHVVGAPATGGSDRLSELLPLILRAMVDERGDHPPEEPMVVRQAEILAALAPYHRPKSRFEGLMMRKLVGEGYLKPRGARDKSGLSDAYEITQKGKNLLAG